MGVVPYGQQREGGVRGWLEVQGRVARDVSVGGVGSQVGAGRSRWGPARDVGWGGGWRGREVGAYVTGGRKGWGGEVVLVSGRGRGVGTGWGTRCVGKQARVTRTGSLGMWWAVVLVTAWCVGTHVGMRAWCRLGQFAALGCRRPAGWRLHTTVRTVGTDEMACTRCPQTL